MNSITVTSNYFADLNAAIAADLLPKNAKPKKTDLYAAIEAFNAPLEVKPATRKVSPKAVKLTLEQTRAMNEDRFECLECLCGDVEVRGRRAIAQMLGTSVSRLTKRVKAYGIMRDRADIKEAFLDGKISFALLSEMAVRRDGLEQLQTALAAC